MSARNRRSGIRLVAVAAAVVVALVLAAASRASARGNREDLRQLRKATEAYQDIDAALAAGYGLFTDAAGVACIIDPNGRGGMGTHYANGALVGDPAVNLTSPEVLLYRETADGFELLGVEHVVLVEAWGVDRPPPRLFGRQLRLVPEGNRYGLPAFYELHVWLYKHNPDGIYKDYNPRVDCEFCTEH